MLSTHPTPNYWKQQLNPGRGICLLLYYILTATLQTWFSVEALPWGNCFDLLLQLKMLKLPCIPHDTQALWSHLCPAHTLVLCIPHETPSHQSWPLTDGKGLQSGAWTKIQSTPVPLPVQQQHFLLTPLFNGWDISPNMKAYFSLYIIFSLVI